MKSLTFFVLLMCTPLLASADYPYLRCFEIASQKHNVPIDLLLGVARTESNFNPDARSDRNAHGIMQIRWPVTARHLGIRRVADLYNPCVNIDAGAEYLAELLNRFDSVEMALAAYNYGPTRLTSPSDVPASVQRYVSRVLRNPLKQDSNRTNSTLVLNTFDSRHRANAYRNSLSAFDNTLRLSVTRGRNNNHLVTLHTSNLTRLQRTRLYRLIPLEQLK